MSHIGQVKVDDGLKILTKIERRGDNETETWVPLVDHMMDAMIACVDIPGVGKYNWTMRELVDIDNQFKMTAERVKEMKRENCRKK